MSRWEIVKTLVSAQSVQGHTQCIPRNIGFLCYSHRPSLIVSGYKRGKGSNTVEIPKATLVERIRSRPKAADSANDELPDKLDLDSDDDARLLRRYDLEPDELREEFGGGSPSTG
jgi:hypothetical protein